MSSALTNAQALEQIGAALGLPLLKYAREASSWSYAHSSRIIAVTRMRDSGMVESHDIDWFDAPALWSVGQARMSPIVQGVLDVDKHSTTWGGPTKAVDVFGRSREWWLWLDEGIGGRLGSGSLAQIVEDVENEKKLEGV